MGFSRQEYWSGLPFPSPGDLPNPGIEPGSPALEADALPSEPPGKSKQEMGEGQIQIHVSEEMGGRQGRLEDSAGSKASLNPEREAEEMVGAKCLRVL